MDQNELKKLFKKYLDGNLTPHEQGMVDAWLSMPEAERIDFYAGEQDEIKTRIWAKLYEQAASQRHGQASSSRVVRIKRHRMVAIWIALLGIGGTAYLLRYRMLNMVDAVKWQTVKTDAFEIRQVRLPDSSWATLAQNTTLTYPVPFRGSDRNVRLSGKAFFDIARAPSSPFKVQTSGLEVKVLGTSFEVEDEPDLAAVHVMVATGKVSVRHDDKELSLLSHDQQTIYDKKTGIVQTKHDINTGILTAWTNNRLVYNETSLATVMQSISAAYGIKFETDPETIKPGSTFSGVFGKREDWKSVLEVVCTSSGLTYSTDQHQTVHIQKNK